MLPDTNFVKQVGFLRRLFVGYLVIAAIPILIVVVGAFWLVTWSTNNILEKKNQVIVDLLREELPALTGHTE